MPAPFRVCAAALVWAGTVLATPVSLAAARPAIDTGDASGPTAVPPNSHRADEAGATVPVGCIGDCDATGNVTVDELMVLVNIALGSAQSAVCPDGVGSTAEIDIALIVHAVNNALSGCRTALTIGQPSEGLVVLAGAVAARIDLPDGIDLTSLAVQLDAADVTGQLTISVGGARGTLSGVSAGQHTLTVRADANAAPLHDEVHFEAVAFANPDECEVLNNTACLLPYPSSRFLVPDAATRTGFRVRLPASGMPPQNGVPIDPAPYGTLDGFNPVGPILMHFPGRVDVAASNAPRLWLDTRSYDTRSLDDDSPTVLLDVDTGERVLHFVEVDAHAAGQPERQVLFLYPSAALASGHRYAVAVRHLRHPDGIAIAAEPAFAVLRDGRPTNIPAVESRRQDFERLFVILANAGIARDGLILAFDFVVRSDESITTDALSMRAQAFAWLEEELTAGSQVFTVKAQRNYDCTVAGTVFGREVTGTYQVPLFLNKDPVVDRLTPAVLRRDEHGAPVAAGTTNTPFEIAIPCAALVADHPLPACVIGHGIFSSAKGWIGSLVTDANRGMPVPEAIFGGTDWVGYTIADALWLANVTAHLDQMPAARDRVVQAQLNAVVWTRLLKSGIFNQHQAFQTASGTGVFAGPEAEACYWGESMGGAETALPFLALSPDIGRALMNVPFTLGLHIQRTGASLQFAGVTDPLQVASVLTLLNDLFLGNVAAYARHIVADSLPGTNAKQVLFEHALYDQAVPNLSSEFLARTMQIPSLEGSVIRNRPGIRERSGPLPSAFVAYDLGAFDAGNPAHAPFINQLDNLPPTGNRCDPHLPWPFDVPALARIALGFLQPGGVIENFCNGLCDASEPAERFCGAQNRCDPFNPPADIGCPAS